MTKLAKDIERFDLPTGSRETRDVKSSPAAHALSANPVVSETYYTGRAPRQTWSAEKTVVALGLMDQAIQGLLALNRGASANLPPRSLLLDIMQISHGFRGKSGPMQTLRLLAASGNCARQLARGWSSTLKQRGSGKDYGRYYQLASLAAVSLVIPWLMLSKRSSTFGR